MSGAFTLDLEKIEAVAKDMVPDSGPEVSYLPNFSVLSIFVGGGGGGRFGVVIWLGGPFCFGT